MIKVKIDTRRIVKKFVIKSLVLHVYDYSDDLLTIEGVDNLITSGLLLRIECRVLSVSYILQRLTYYPKNKKVENGLCWENLGFVDNYVNVLNRT